MSKQRVKAIAMRHMFETWRNPDRFVDSFYWPLLDIVVWGFFTIYLTRGKGLQPNIISMLLGAVIVWSMFYGFQRDIAVGFLEELWTRNLINLFSTPLTALEYMTALIVV